MSNVHSTLSHSPPSPDRPTPPDLAALAVSLQEAAQALRALYPVSMADKPKEPAAKPPARQNDGETRSFYFPASTIHQERELLRKYRAEDYIGLLEEVHTLLVGLVKLMRSVHKDVRVRGYVISSLGAQIDHASALVLRMRNVYEKVIPLQK